MPQVSQFQPVVTPQSLAAIDGMRPSYMPDVWNFLERGSQADQASLTDLMRQTGHERTMDPIRVHQGEATLASTMAKTEGQRLDNTMKGYDNEVANSILPQKKITELKKLVTEGSEATHKAIEFEIDKMLRSGDPKQQAYGKQLLDASRKSIEERRAKDLAWENRKKELDITEGGANSRQGALFKHQIALEEQRTNGRVKVAELNNAVKKAKLDAGGSPKKWQELAVQLGQAALKETDPEAKAALNEEMQFAQQMAERLAPQPAPQVNPEAIPGKDGKPAILVQPRPASVPGVPGSTPAVIPAPEAAIQMLKSQYKSIPGLAAAFDAKYGPGSAAKILGR